jgi:hypothetical protein
LRCCFCCFFYDCCHGVFLALEWNARSRIKAAGEGAFDGTRNGRSAR